MSLNTLRTHTKNIYAKLGVTSRRAAVRRAQDLDLLPGHRADAGLIRRRFGRPASAAGPKSPRSHHMW